MKSIYRKIYTTIGAALLITAPVLTSCSDDSEGIERAPQQITFATPVISGMTRAAGEVTGTAYPTGEQFIVVARRYQGAFQGWNKGTEKEIDMEPKGTANPKDIVKYNGTYSVWHTAEPHYWLDGYKYAFAAVSPASLRDDAQIESMSYGGTGLRINNFRPSTDLSKHVDIMYSERITDKTSETSGAGVDINFKHALASVHFKVCVSPDFVREMAADEEPGNDLKLGDIQIRSIKLTGSINSATFKEKIDETNKKTDPAVWEVPNTAEEALLTNEYLFVSSAISLPITNVGGVADAAKDVKEYGGFSAMMIPQTLLDGAMVTIEYTKNGNAGTGTTWDTATIYLKDHTTEWKMGYRYTYTIAFTSETIYFAPNVTEMKDKGFEIL